MTCNSLKISHTRQTCELRLVNQRWRDLVFGPPFV